MRFVGAPLLAVATFSLTACASTGDNCPGGPLRLADGRSPQDAGALVAAEVLLNHRPLSEISCLAQAGDKYAQFAMGHALENGRGTSPDLPAAARFYSLAAQDVIGSRQVYSAPVGSESSGTVISIPGQVLQHGLPEAAVALARLQHSGL